MHITIMVDRQKHEVGGRAAQIICWLLTRLEQINRTGVRGEIIIAYKQGSLVVSLKEVEDLPQ